MFHKYHKVEGYVYKSIDHTNILPFSNQIKDCEEAVISSSVLLKKQLTSNLDLDNKTIFIGLEFGGHVLVGGHLKIGFNIPTK